MNLQYRCSLRLGLGEGDTVPKLCQEIKVTFETHKFVAEMKYLASPKMFFDANYESGIIFRCFICVPSLEQKI